MGHQKPRVYKVPRLGLRVLNVPRVNKVPKEMRHVPTSHPFQRGALVTPGKVQEIMRVYCCGLLSVCVLLSRSHGLCKV